MPSPCSSLHTLAAPRTASGRLPDSGFGCFPTHSCRKLPPAAELTTSRRSRTGMAAMHASLRQWTAGACETSKAHRRRARGEHVAKHLGKPGGLFRRWGHHKSLMRVVCCSTSCAQRGGAQSLAQPRGPHSAPGAPPAPAWRSLKGQPGADGSPVGPRQPVVGGDRGLSDSCLRRRVLVLQHLGAVSRAALEGHSDAVPGSLLDSDEKGVHQAMPGGNGGMPCHSVSRPPAARAPGVRTEPHGRISPPVRVALPASTGIACPSQDESLLPPAALTVAPRWLAAQPPQIHASQPALRMGRGLEADAHWEHGLSSAAGVHV